MLLYSRLFNWVVAMIDASMQNNNKKSIDAKSMSFIGVLDIYGFEVFQTNSFEQFTINYANEKLQQQFNQYIFKMEQLEYTKEGVDWSYIEFNDNQACVDLLESKPMCIVTILDEETRFPKATAESLALKLTQTFFGKVSHAHFNKPAFGQTGFTVLHYAGPVTYSTATFLEKNRDYLIPEQQSCLAESTDEFVRTLFGRDQKKQLTRTDSTNKFVSVISQVRARLHFLLLTCNQVP